jgi:hypothetical protein
VTSDNDVYLVPATPSAINELQRVFGGDFFTFPNVRAGKWHVMTSVVWTVSDNYQGGCLLGSAEVADGQEIEVVLTQ